MKSIRKMFNENVRLIFTEKGFKRKGDVYFRVINDVVQHFNLTIYSTNDCDVDYSVTPLAAGLEYLPGGRLSLAKASIKTYEGWKYDPKSDESKKNCIEDIIRSIEIYMIPFFERVDDCKSALEETILAEKLQYKNYCLYMKNVFHIEPPLGLISAVNLCDGYKLWMALKCGDRRSAQTLYHAIIGQNIMSYVSVKNFSDSEQLAERYKIIEDLTRDAHSVAYDKNPRGVMEKIIENEKLSMKTLLSI